MDDLRNRVKALMHEIEFTHLKKIWVEQAIEAGIAKEDVYKWVAEIGHIVDEYERSLRFLIDLLEQKNTEKIARELESWIAYTHDMTVWKLDDVMNELELRGNYKQYLPPELDNEDES
jgi:hypothetical protein